MIKSLNTGSRFVHICFLLSAQYHAFHIADDQYYLLSEFIEL